MSDKAVPAVQTVGLARSYKRGRIPVPALNGVDLTIQKGEVVGIIGPSGSGKTTMLNLIGGLDRPNKGKVLIDGVDLGGFNDAQLADYRLRKIGFIFQFYNLISTLSALENVEVPMSLAKVPLAEQEDRAVELLTSVGLEARIDHMPDELSGGEQQRVAVARALANHPSVILADEPTGDLDSKSAKALMDLIKSLQKEKQVTFVLVTHDPLVVVDCDRTYSFRDGTITHEASKAENDKLAELDRAMLDRLY
jgi:putative ABC transport system ATP-binding protein